MDLIQTIDFANIANSFASGTGDYVQLFEPQASIFEREGIGRIVASFGKESGRIPYTTFMAKQSYLTKTKKRSKSSPARFTKRSSGLRRTLQKKQPKAFKIILKIPSFQSLHLQSNGINNNSLLLLILFWMKRMEPASNHHG